MPSVALVFRNRQLFLDNLWYRQQRAGPQGVHFQADGKGRNDFPCVVLIPPPAGLGDQLQEEPRPVDGPAILDGGPVIVRARIESVRTRTGTRGPACADGKGDRAGGGQDPGEGNLRSPEETG